MRATPPTPVAEDAERRHDPMPDNPPEQRIMDPPGMTWEQIMEENDFHDIVNNDAEMDDAIENIPSDSDDLADQVMSVVQSHVSEVWSVPRVTKLAHQFGLNAGFAYDLLTHDETGEPWDFDKKCQREKRMRHVMEKNPQYFTGSPMCTAFSALQRLNKWRMNPKKWDALMEKGLRHMRFAIKLYRLQAIQGRWFLHEHPNSASSWKLPDMQ